MGADESSCLNAWPLLLLVAADLGWSVFLATTRALPAGHDGFQYFYLKYYFFADFVRSGELPMWLPYVAHGQPAVWWSVLQSGIFDPIMLAAGRLLRPNNFFFVFYTLLFAERVLLLTGSWLFAGEHLRSRQAIFVVAAAVDGTSIWFTQPWWNFHAIVAVPMMLFFLHRSAVDFHWRWLFALILLLYLQTFGQPSYYLPMTLLFLALYGAALIGRRDIRARFIERFHVHAGGILAVAAVCAAFALEFVWLERSSGDIAFAGTERSANGLVSIDTFLNYVGYTDLKAWNQFFSGLTPHLDFTMFAGFLIAGLTILAATGGRLTRTERLFAGLTVAIVLIETASPVATLLFYFFPMSRVFRHLGLLAPAAKFFCILLAGATLDDLLRGDRETPSRRRLYIMAAVLGAWLVLLVAFALKWASIQSFVTAQTTVPLPVLPSYASDIAARGLWRATIFLGLTLMLLIVLAGRIVSRPTLSRCGSAAAIVLLLDVSTYGAREAQLRSIPLSTNEAALFHFTDVQYVQTRTDTPDAMSDVRLRDFAPVIRRLVGERYWTENLLWMTDTYRSGNRAVYWSAALESLLQPFSDDSGSDLASRLSQAAERGPLRTIAGVREPKARLLSRAVICSDVPSTIRVLASSRYRGQAALLTEAPNSHAAAVNALSGIATADCDPTMLPADSVSATGSVTASRFTSNVAEFDVENRSGSPLVLAYSDSWDRAWRARVDAKDTTLFRSDLAYKAVVVPSGNARVTLEYRDLLGELVFRSQRMASLIFVLLLVLLPRLDHGDREVLQRLA